MEKLLSIVIPVYKVEAYIKKCLDSLIIAPELMDKMDVLIINDGTPDRSAEISREYVKRFPGVFRQIDKENGGHGSVWNLGLKEAQGKFIKFLDSDDWLENLDVLLEKLESCDADLVLTHTICHIKRGKLGELIRGNDWKLEIKSMQFGNVYDADTFDWINNQSHSSFMLHHCCTYKTEVLRQYLPLFLEKQPYDDLILRPAVIIGANSLVAYDIVLYHYLMNREGQSISKEAQERNIQAKMKSQQYCIEFVERHQVPNDSSKAVYFKERKPKSYNFGYKTFVQFPYKEAKHYTKVWDDWVTKHNPSIKTQWIKLYHLLPFWMYRIIVKIKS
jgi:glycosyltransferase involved in cell wall biosynthesis